MRTKRIVLAVLPFVSVPMLAAAASIRAQQIATTQAEQLGANWAQAIAADGNPTYKYEPWVYYADQFGAFYFDNDYNRIYPVAALPLDGLSGSVAAPTASCWQFNFTLNGYYYPNPFNNYTQVQSANLNLLVLGTDYQFYSATITSNVYNTLGQLVKSSTIGTFASSPSFVVTSWDGKNNSGVPVASGNYVVKLTATSSLCGSKTISGGSTVIH